MNVRVKKLWLNKDLGLPTIVLKVLGLVKVHTLSIVSIFGIDFIRIWPNWIIVVTNKHYCLYVCIYWNLLKLFDLGQSGQHPLVCLHCEIFVSCYLNIVGLNISAVKMLRESNICTVGAFYNKLFTSSLKRALSLLNQKITQWTYQENDTWEREFSSLLLSRVKSNFKQNFKPLNLEW